MAKKPSATERQQYPLWDPPELPPVLPAAVVVDGANTLAAAYVGRRSAFGRDFRIGWHPGQWWRRLPACTGAAWPPVVA